MECFQVTHGNSLCLTVDLERTEAFWEIELLKMKGGRAALPLLRRTQFRQDKADSSSAALAVSVRPLFFLPPAPKSGTPTARSDL